MSRKHYIRVADLLAGEYASAANDQERLLVRNIAYSMADIFRQDNARFDRQRFYDAIGL